MRTLICGSRTWNKYKIVVDWLKRLPSGTTLIHGGAKGADEMASWFWRDYGRQYNMHVTEYHAEWEKHGKAAGPIRNQEMITEGKPDNALAFCDGIEFDKNGVCPKTPGTKDMVNKLRRALISVTLIDSNGNSYE